MGAWVGRGRGKLPVTAPLTRSLRKGPEGKKWNLSLWPKGSLDATPKHGSSPSLRSQECKRPSLLTFSHFPIRIQYRYRTPWLLVHYVRCKDSDARGPEGKGRRCFGSAITSFYTRLSFVKRLRTKRDLKIKIDIKRRAVMEELKSITVLLCQARNGRIR